MFPRCDFSSLLKNLQVTYHTQDNSPTPQFKAIFNNHRLVYVFQINFWNTKYIQEFWFDEGKLNKICRITSLCFSFPYCISTSVFPVLPAFNKWSIMDINRTIFDWQFTKAMFSSKQHVLFRISTEWSDLQALTLSTYRQTHKGVLTFSF